MNYTRHVQQSIQQGILQLFKILSLIISLEPIQKISCAAQIVTGRTTGVDVQIPGVAIQTTIYLEITGVEAQIPGVIFGYN